jgi:hypothetical protein
MTTSTVLINQPDALDLEDELLDFTADLLALKANQVALVALFERSAGQWVNLSELVQGLPAVQRQLTDLEGLAPGPLRVTWLRHPETSEDYCLVLFFMESLGWDNLALYHRALVQA